MFVFPEVWWTRAVLQIPCAPSSTVSEDPAGAAGNATGVIPGLWSSPMFEGYNFYDPPKLALNHPKSI